MKKVLIKGACIFALSAFLFSCNNESEADTATPAPTTESLPGSENLPAPSGTTTLTPSENSTGAAAVADQGALNPEHGQPGHRCDIPVGAPLSSPPGNGTNATPTPTPTITTTPVVNTTPAPNEAKASGSGRLNPAHGEPGHDCTVAVGAPLP